MRPWVKITAGIFTAGSVIAFFIVWNLYLEDEINSTPVVIVKPGETIETKEVITENKLTIENRNKKDLVKDVIVEEDLDSILGKEAAFMIVGNQMVAKSMIDYDDVLPNKEENEAIRPIPSSWIYAAPGSLRRKDKIDIYVVSRELIAELEKTDTPFYPAAPQETEAKKQEAGNTQTSLELELLTTPILTDISVVYVKDQGNKEVMDSTDLKQSSRLNGTGIISDLEVILNQEDFKKLLAQVLEDGNSLYITYN